MPVCNYCGSEKSSIAAEYTRLWKNNVRQCSGCGMVYLEQKKTREEIEKYYSHEYRHSTVLPNFSPEDMHSTKVSEDDANNRIRYTKKYIDLGDKKVLEIGSSAGNFMEKLEGSGCDEVVGVELNEEFADFVIARGHTVFTQPIEKLNYTNYFDLVVSFHTLEHVFDAMATFQAIQRALKKGGHFVGEVPNDNDWRIRLFNDEIVRRLHYDPNHYYYYSPQTLINYLSFCRFGIINMETVERYSSLRELKNIFTDLPIEESLQQHAIYGKGPRNTPLPIGEEATNKFNRMFEMGINSELMGNCIRWVATLL